MYRLYAIGFHFDGHHYVGDVNVCETCIASRPSATHVLQMIISREKKKNADTTPEWIYLCENGLDWLNEQTYPVERTHGWLEGVKVIAVYGIDADETDHYVVVEEADGARPKMVPSGQVYANGFKAFGSRVEMIRFLEEENDTYDLAHYSVVEAVLNFAITQTNPEAYIKTSLQKTLDPADIDHLITHCCRKVS